MGDRLSLFEKRMINVNGDMQERVIYQRHMAEDIFTEASGIITSSLAEVELGDLADVDITAPAAGHVLAYDVATGHWINKHITAV